MNQPLLGVDFSQYPRRGSTFRQPSAAVNLASSTTSTIAGVNLSPVAITSVRSDVNAPTMMVSEPTSIHVIQTAVATVTGVSVGETEASSPSEAPGSSGVPVKLSSGDSTPTISTGNPSSHVRASPSGDSEEEKKGTLVGGQMNLAPAEEKTVDDEPVVYATKQEAKNAFKALLESTNLEADWTWDQAMRVIINDKKTLGEWKQAFNEYLMKRKKVEAEERRLRQRKAKEEFMKMLEKSEELTSSTRWSKAVTMFEDDRRFKAVELEADREDLFRNYLVDLQKKRDIAREEGRTQGHAKDRAQIPNKLDEVLA